MRPSPWFLGFYQGCSHHIPLQYSLKRQGKARFGSWDTFWDKQATLELKYLLQLPYIRSFSLVLNRWNSFLKPLSFCYQYTGCRWGLHLLIRGEALESFQYRNKYHLIYPYWYRSRVKYRVHQSSFGQRRDSLPYQTRRSLWCLYLPKKCFEFSRLRGRLFQRWYVWFFFHWFYSLSSHLDRKRLRWWQYLSQLFALVPQLWLLLALLEMRLQNALHLVKPW